MEREAAFSRPQQGCSISEWSFVGCSLKLAATSGQTFELELWGVRVVPT